MKGLLRVLGRVLAILLETLVLTAAVLLGAVYILEKGPSPAARDLFVMSVRETSAIGFLAELFLSPEEIAAIENKPEEAVYVPTDTSLINFPRKEEKPEGPVADEWGLMDEDGDGIIVEPVKGLGYSGFMMVILDPSRVTLGTVPDTYGEDGYTVAEMVERFDAVAGINAGGFEDPNGAGNGSLPNTLVVSEGEIYYPEKGVKDGFVGFDSSHILHVGKLTPEEIREKDIRSGVCFGPVLVANGEPCDLAASGVNPRTAIGQRSDGAVLMLVIDGRQVISLGATHQDMIDIFLQYGAVNACNLDGGSSSLMWYQGDYINNCASVIGIRPVPTAFLVMKEGAENG